MTVEIISLSISKKVWDRVQIELATPGSAVRHISTVRHGTDYTMLPGTCMNSYRVGLETQISAGIFIYVCTLCVQVKSLVTLRICTGSSEIPNACICRPLVKSALQKINFLFPQCKHMLWVLKRTISMRWFF